MLNLALWLKERKFKLDQVQNFYPSPMANATTIYHTELNSLKNVKHTSEVVPVPKKGRQRRLHKALLRYHDPAGWPIIREGLIAMGREDLIGNSPNHLVPPEGRNERGPKWMKDANQGQKALTRFSGNQFDERKGKGDAKGKPSASKPKGPKSSGANATQGQQPKSSRPGAKAPFGQSGFKGKSEQGKAGHQGRGNKASSGRQHAK